MGTDEHRKTFKQLLINLNSQNLNFSYDSARNDKLCICTNYDFMIFPVFHLHCTQPSLAVPSHILSFSRFPWIVSSSFINIVWALFRQLTASSWVHGIPSSWRLCISRQSHWIFHLKRPRCKGTVGCCWDLIAAQFAVNRRRVSIPHERVRGNGFNGIIAVISMQLN